jgi:hypothetical protein
MARYKACFTCAFLMLWYVNSCWWCWWFGEAFGGRAFLELAAMFVLGFALLFRELSRFAASARIALTGLVGVALVYHYALMALYILNYIPRDNYLLSF